MRVSFRRLVIIAVVLAVAGTAAAQCSRGPDTATVTLPDFLAVYYSQFRSLSSEDAAEFYGGVCVTAVGGEWTVMAESVRLEELSGDIRLEAPAPTLYMNEWRMTGDLLRATGASLTLVNAKVVGPDLVGSASNLRVNLVTGQMSMTRLQMEGSALAVRGDLAVLEGSALRLDGAGITTCIGVEVAPYEVLGEVAHVDLDDLRVRLNSGSLRVGRLVMPLREELVISEDTFASIELPVRMELHLGGPSRRGAGLGVRLVNIPVADDVKLVVGGTGLSAGYVADVVALLELEAMQEESVGFSRVGAVVGLEAGAPFMDVSVGKQLLPWLSVEFGARSGAAPGRQAVHEGYGVLSARRTVPLLGEGSGVSSVLSGSLSAAATSQTSSAYVARSQALGLRLGVAGSANTTWRASASSTFSLLSGAQATYYPFTVGTAVATAGPVTQWGVRLVPAWRYASGPFTISVRYEALFTNAASPFDVVVDRLTPLQRLTGSFRVRGKIWESEAGAISGTFGVNVEYDPFVTSTSAGLKRLLLDGSVSFEDQPWTVTLEGRSELSGLLTPVGRDPFVTLSLGASRGGWPVMNPTARVPHVPHGTVEFGLLAGYSLVPGNEGLSELQLSAAIPFAFNTVELRPYTAFDFAPMLLHGQAPSWSGYGLDATFITCCGSLTLSVLNDRGAWGAGIGVDLERRPRFD